MLIGLHDSDRTGFPNLALMKLAAWHKAQGDQVEWWIPMQTYDKVYSSKIFTFSAECEYLPADTIKGGTGYGLYDELPVAIDVMRPDYSIYPDCNYAIGYLTRGCIRNCPWCVVPKKEGTIKPYRTWREIKRPDSNRIVFMDNNVLASDHGREQMYDMIGKRLRIDFNQGMDARLIDDDAAQIISQLDWIRFVRMSCDTDAMLESVLRAVGRLGKYHVRPHRVFVYLLVQDVQSALYRAERLKAAGVEVFAQPYRDFENQIEPTKEMRRFARWVNHKAIFKSVEWEDYKR